MFYVVRHICFLDDSLVFPSTFTNLVNQDSCILVKERLQRKSIEYKEEIRFFIIFLLLFSF